MSLTEYRRKRDFTRTAEPRGGRRRAARRLSFVVQKHAASRLHYDFRLEWGGTLKSWAVPKGPRLDPAVKSLAIEVEDHPVEYGSFEGRIPEGEYGAGSVLLWDRGWWEPVGDAERGLREGRLQFVLHGKKLRGGWRLIRTGRSGARSHWLLFKSRDEHVRPASEYDVLEDRPESVASGRRLEEIGARSRVWSSRGERARARDRTRRARSGPVSEGTKGTVVSSPAKPGEVSVRGVRLSSPDRLLWPDEGIVKADLAAYYDAVGDLMLPYIAERPLMLVRCPEGLPHACFHQKHPPGPIPEPLRGTPIKEKTKTETYLYMTEARGLIALAQVSALEIHTWGSRVGDLERPDRVIFDLDPGPGVAWAKVVGSARALREALAALGLTSFVKTSGGKGLHVVVPLRPAASWEQVKRFAQWVSEEFVRWKPREYAATISKSARPGKIYIDYLRNGRGATCVEAYSTRARAGAAVSMPVSWAALARVGSASEFNVRNAVRRLRSSKDPWKASSGLRQSLSARLLRGAGIDA